MSASEREFMLTLANHTSQALERALLFDQQRGVADALQRAVLPPELPQLPGWGLDAQFVPATSGLEVGGDWYDAFWLPSGRLALAVGDAAGHGLAAARVMSAVRNALRAFAMLGEGPARVVHRLDDLLARLEPQAFATLVYVELDVTTGQARLAAAGHPPPLRCRVDDAHYLDLDVEPPLGCGGISAADGVGDRELTFQVDEGDVLLLYTDGLVERRDDDLLAGLERLRLAGETTSAADLLGRPGAATRVLDVALAQLRQAGGSRDDVCALAIHRQVIDRQVIDREVIDREVIDRQVRADGPAVADPVATRTAAAPARTMRVVLRPRPQSVGEAREQTRAALTAWGLAELADGVTLIVSELVTNAVTHAGTPAVLEVTLAGDTLRISVADQSINEPELRDPDSSEEHGRGVALVDALADRWGTAQRSSGKQVWAEVTVRPTEQPAE
jgi:anti-sigma regulatory factor (Ser/Thr protein kinase)